MRALAAGYRPRSVLTEPKWLPDLAASLEGSGAEVLLADPDVLRAVTGYRVHRGALASFERRPLPPPSALLAAARFVVVLVDLVDHTNVGAIFRNAAALGADAVLVTPGCADPLYRRSVKVSMGTVLAVPWTRTGADPLADLAGFTTIALTPAPDALDVDDVAPDTDRRAVLLGTEGDGLPEDGRRPGRPARADPDVGRRGLAERGRRERHRPALPAATPLTRSDDRSSGSRPRGAIMSRHADPGEEPMSTPRSSRWSKCCSRWGRSGCS